MSIVPNLLFGYSRSFGENENIRAEVEMKSHLIRIGTKLEWWSNGGESVALKLIA